MRRILYFFLFFLLCSLIYAKNSDKAEKIFDEGFDYLKNGDTVKAIKYIQKAAHADYPAAQRVMVYCYLSGTGVPQDIKKAEYWAKRFTEGTILDYRTCIGLLYLNYLEKDILELAHWLKAPAEQGDSLAQFMLSLCYNEGGDYKKAEYWIHNLAEQGNDYAQYNLGTIYENMKNMERAVYWYKKAAEQGYMRAQSHLGFMYQDGDGVEKDNNLAIYWFEKAAEQGHYGVQLHLGELYYGDNEMRDYSKAAYWYKKAAEQGSADASDHLFYMYLSGRGVPKDFEKAKYWKNIADSLYDAGNQYYRRNKTILNLPETKYFLSGAPQNYKIEKRIALVIANSDYDKPVPSAEKDASALIKTLSSLHFSVVPCINKEQNDMENCIADFCEKAKGYDVALIYYAGYAVQEKGVNYLIPARPVKLRNAVDIKYKCTMMPWVIESLQEANVKKNIIIIDACRESPSFLPPDTKDKDGLAPFASLRSFVFAFPAGYGKIIKNGTDKEVSLYMTALLEELNKPYQDIDEIFRNVRDGVIKHTNGEQVPCYINTLKENEREKFYFNINK